MALVIKAVGENSEVMTPSTGNQTPRQQQLVAARKQAADLERLRAQKYAAHQSAVNKARRAQKANGLTQEEDSVFRFRCEHCLLLNKCAECRKGKTALQLRRNLHLYEMQMMESLAARREKVVQLNTELDEELRQEQRRKYRAKSPERVSCRGRRGRKLRFSLADVPYPVKERELRYEDFAHNNQGLLLQWGNRLSELQYDRQAWRRELDWLLAMRGCAPKN